MIAYIIKVSICWILFYAMYQLLYKKITFFSANRMYLIITLILGAAIPLLQYVQISTPTYEVIEYVTPILYEVDNIQAIMVEQESFNYMQILTILYCIGLFLFSLRFLFGMYKIFEMYSNGEKEFKVNYVLVYTEKPHLPFSFYKWVFISKQIPLKEKVNTVLKHELCHIDQRHTLDVILMELVKIIFWCSPPIYLYKKALKQVHEYIADNVTVAQQDKEEYGQLLLGQSSSGIELSLTHQFFNSHLKKRITMINQKRSSRAKLVLYLALVPVLLIMGLSFTNYMDNSELTTEKTSLTENGDPIKEIENAVSAHFNSSEMKNKKTLQDLYESLAKKYPNHITTIQTEFKKNAFMRGMSLDVNNMEENRKYIIDTISTFDYDTYEETVKIVKTERGKDPVIMKRTSYDLFDTITVFNADTYEETVRIVRTEGDPQIAQEIDKGLGSILLKRSELKDGKCARMMVEYYEDMLQKYPEKKNIVQKYARDFFIEMALHPAFEQYKLMGLRFISSAKAPAPPPPPPAPSSMISDDGEVFKVVEEMPRFPGCEEVTDKKERDKCAKEKMLHFIYKNLKYPAEARKAGIQGMCVVQFVVEKDGSVAEVNLVRKIGGGCGDASKEVVHKMNVMDQKWIPGKQRGQNVRVLYTLPIRFKLENENNTSTKTKEENDDITLIAHGEAKEEKENNSEKEEKENFIIILDGEEVEDLKSLDKLKIKTVTVLKGASAIEKYGMRAKDGVVILQTGESGKELSSTYTEMRSVGELKVNDFKVYPNPANDQLDISFKTTEKGDVKIHIFDVEGKVLREHSSYSDIGSFNKTFNLSDIASGNLFLTIEQNDKVLTQKVIKQ